MKKVIIGFIAGVLFATAGTAMAKTAIEKITASVRTDYTLELDGKKVDLKNAPLAYDGASYLPVREVSEILGKDVDFKDGVIKLTTPIADPAAELDRLEKNLAILKNNVEAFNKNLEGDLSPEQRKVMEEAVDVNEKAIVETEQKIANLLEQYPELKESA